MWRRNLVSIVVAASVAACVQMPDATEGSSTTASTPWASEAEGWLDGWYLAGEEGQANRLLFMAEDVVFEDRTGGQVIRGRDEFIEFGIGYLGPVDPTQPVRMFLSADELLDQSYWAEPVPVDWLDRFEMDGATVERLANGASVASGRLHAPDARDFGAIEALADRYVGFWNGTDQVAVSGLYGPRAAIEDSLHGESVQGVNEIASLAGTRGGLDLPNVAIAALGGWPDTMASPPSIPRGRAIYISPSDVDRWVPDEVRLVLEVDDGSGCPGWMAVALAWDRERVLWERRYHELESIRRCADPGDLQPGWWEGIEVPEPVRVEETDPMIWAQRGITVRIYNGNADMERFVRWGFQRFSMAGLPLPGVGSVTFLSQHSKCDGFHGFFGVASDDVDIILCDTSDEVCADHDCSSWRLQSRRTLLHEFSHAWMREHLGEARQEEFLAFEGIPRWSDSNDPWHDRGMERAAEALAFGLIDHLGLAWFTPERPCEHYLDGFRVLTDRDPLSPCP